MRIKNEIKFLHIKKQHLNRTLYSLHIDNANKWKNIWHIIDQNITEEIEEVMKTKYKNLNKKIHVF
jgi:hypothetical protein